MSSGSFYRMYSRSKILAEVIYPAAREIAPLLANPEIIRNDPELRLFGRDGVLDSLGLVSLVVAVEQQVEEVFRKHVVLVSDRAMSRSESPFRTLGSLADYVVEILSES